MAVLLLGGSAMAQQPALHAVSAERKDTEWSLSVCDNGIGIESHYHPEAFEVQTATRQKVVCIGLGLTICQKIVERYGGHIRVESEPGTGATFRFSRLGEPGVWRVNRRG